MCQDSKHSLAKSSDQNPLIKRLQSTFEVQVLFQAHWFHLNTNPDLGKETVLKKGITDLRIYKCLKKQTGEGFSFIEKGK